MQIFIWDRVAHATWRLHHEAGVVIIALTLANARHMFKEWQNEHSCYDERSSVYLLEPTVTIPIAPRAHKVFVFPDAGCC